MTWKVRLLDLGGRVVRRPKREIKSNIYSRSKRPSSVKQSLPFSIPETTGASPQSPEDFIYRERL
jgi:hypothetical protein